MLKEEKGVLRIVKKMRRETLTISK